MNKWFKKSLFACLTLVLLAANVSPTIAQATETQNALAPRFAQTKPIHTKITDWQSRDVIQVKFAEGSTYRLRNGGITSLGSDPLDGIKAVFQAHPVKQIERLFTLPEEQIEADKVDIQSLSNEQLPDLNLWYRITLSKGTDAETLIDALNALPEVELAAPALLPAPLPTGPSNDVQTSPLPAPLLASPNYISQQGYLNTATNGIDAKYAWGLPGGNGKKVTIVDIEYSFNKNHEDLPNIPLIGGKMYNGFGNDHGTAVMGELVSKSNSYGVKGITYAAKVKFSSACMNSSCSNYNPANAVNTARAKTAYGDVILIEQQTAVCGGSDYGPLEWDQAVFDAIQLATQSGRIVVEAAGNGSVNLDGAGCGTAFNKAVRDSGAIIVGAGSPPSYPWQVDRSRLDYSTYGSRVDVQGWGYNVVTTGYGDLHKGSGKNQWYTAQFSGTSSSSPIVAGAAAILSSIAEQNGSQKSPDWIRSTLTSTGSPQQSDPSYPSSQHIGPRPDLKAAIAQLGPDFTSDFDADAFGWSQVKGNWSIVSSTYSTPGIVNRWSSIVHKDPYTTLDFQVRMKRQGCLTCANAIIVRGTTKPLKKDYWWNKGYSFQYANNGYISVWEIKPGKVSHLLNWIHIDVINESDWNILHVVANENDFSFYINDTLVWTGSDSTLKTGRVGIAAYRYNDADTSPENFSVDWASMSNVAPPPSVPAAPIELGASNTDWTDYRVAPPR